MKTLTATLTTAALLAGCASSTEPPNSALVVEREIAALSRTEVIAAVTECENAGLNALVLYGKRRINGQPSSVVVDVTCLPVPRRPR